WSLALTSAPAWTEITPPDPGPGARLEHAAIYDPVRGRMLVYGGWTFSGTNVTTFGDVWALDLTGAPAWTQVLPGGPTPLARILTSAVYDAVSDRLVICAGQTSYAGGILNDTWGLSLTGSPSWAQIPANGSVPASRAHAAIIDPATNRMILTGGFSGGDYTRCLALPLTGPPVWSPLVAPGPAVSPIRRSGHFALFDDARSRLLVYSGFTYEATPGYLSDLWSYSTQSGTWSEIPTSGSPFGGGAVAFDSYRDRLVFVSGGWSSFRGDRLDQVVT